MKRIFESIVLLSLVLVRTLVAGAADGKVETPSDLVGRKMAVVVGSMMGDMTLKVQPGIGVEWFNDYNSGIEALRLGKVDAVPLDFFYARRWAMQNPGSFAITEPYHSIPWGYFFAKGCLIRDKVQGVLSGLEKSGELKRILDKWTESADPGALALDTLDYRKNFTGKAGTFRFATPGDREPVSFRRADGIVGFDIDIVRRIAYELDMSLEIVQISMGALVPAVQSGKAEMGGGGIAITEARAEQVDFSDCYYRVPTVFLVRAESSSRRRTSISMVEDLKASFIRTFVTEDRWKLMATGLGVTLLITFLATVLGTILAFPLWLARTSRHVFVCGCAKSCISILQGTPVLVLLMVLFYLVFGKVNIDGVWVAVVGFALNFAAYSSEMLRSGIDSIPRGQTEAALALGYPRKKAFFRFILPQAVRAILPVYRGEIISVLKATSVVGYIAINDLTKASDLVRSRTYESFFPILTTAFIYFVAAWAIARLLDRLGRHLEIDRVGKSHSGYDNGGRLVRRAK